MVLTSKTSFIVAATHSKHLLPKDLRRHIDVRLRPAWTIEISSGGVYEERSADLNVSGQ